MGKAVAEFPSQYFYGGRLVTMSKNPPVVANTAIDPDGKSEDEKLPSASADASISDNEQGGYISGNDVDGSSNRLGTSGNSNARGGRRPTMTIPRKQKHVSSTSRTTTTAESPINDLLLSTSATNAIPATSPSPNAGKEESVPVADDDRSSEVISSTGTNTSTSSTGNTSTSRTSSNALPANAEDDESESSNSNDDENAAPRPAFVR